MLNYEERTRRPANVSRARGLALLALCALTTAAPLSARADVITDWNAVMAATVTGSPAQHGRAAAITHAAIFDAVNAIERRHTVYAVSPPVIYPASQEAAAVAAAYGVLVRLFPAAKPSLEAQYAASLAQIPDGDARQHTLPPHARHLERGRPQDRQARAEELPAPDARG
jgi:hypothetical protein